MNRQLTSITTMAVLALLICASEVSARRGPPEKRRDFTTGIELGDHDNPWTLGPIGATGHIHDRMGVKQIPVITVAVNSPADGKLRMKDVILGINAPVPPLGKKGGKFTADDIAREFAQAIDMAEGGANGGKLSLKVWRAETTLEMVKPWKRAKFKVRKRTFINPLKSKIINVTIELPQIGTFSSTAPWNCKKTDTIVDLIAEAITKTPASKRSLGDIGSYMDAIGLLATGEKKYLPTVRDYAHRFVKNILAKEKIKKMEGGNTWYMSYQLLFLTEYYLTTKDETVMPVIKLFSHVLGRGVSGVGTWSHGTADIKANGGLYGPPCAYGAMNQVSIVAGMTLLLAKKCGVRDPYVNKALELSLKFYTEFVDRGCIPYGDHGPIAEKFDANGRMSIAAVYYDLAGMPREANYYTRMALASHGWRENGHTGHFFSWQWGAAGAARGGPAAAQAFCKSTRYFTELSRKYNGGAIYQPMRTYRDSKTRGKSTAGQLLVQYCLPRKALYITGKGGTCVTPIVGDELQRILAARDFKPEGLSIDKLLAALKSGAPPVRLKAAKELGLRDDDVVDTLLAMLDGPSRFGRYGACTALKFTGGRRREKVFEKLIAIVANDDDWVLRHHAAGAINGGGIKRYEPKNPLGRTPRKYGPILLKIASTIDLENDPRQKLPAALTNLLFDKNGIYGEKEKDKITAADRSQIRKVLKSYLISPNGGTRSCATQAIKLMKTDELEDMWGVMHYAVTHPAPSGVMFGGGVFYNIYAAMARNHIKEGLPLAVDWVFYKSGWGNHGRKKSVGMLAPYGRENIMPHVDKKMTGTNYMKWRDVKNGVNKIKATPSPKKLVSIEKQIEAFEKEMEKKKIRVEN